MDISLATAEDVPALVALWNASFGPDFPLTERLLRQTLDGDPFYEPEGNQVIRVDGQTVAWVLCKSMKSAGPEVGRFQRCGGIGALCVHPNYRRRGLATALLDSAEAHLRTQGSPLTTLYYPHHLLPGIPAQCEAAIALFRRRGYTGFRECVDLWRDLTEYSIPAKAEAAIAEDPSVRLRPARDNEAEAVLDMVAREFPGGWTYSTRAHFERGGTPADIIVAVERGGIMGFCHTADWRSPWLLPSVYWHPLLGQHYGGLGPIGIAAAHRKRGLGLALTAVAVADLQRRGVGCMGIDWTTLIDFYAQLGFSVWRRYLQAEHPIC